MTISPQRARVSATYTGIWRWCWQRALRPPPTMGYDGRVTACSITDMEKYTRDICTHLHIPAITFSMKGAGFAVWCDLFHRRGCSAHIDLRHLELNCSCEAVERLAEILQGRTMNVVIDEDGIRERRCLALSASIRSYSSLPRRFVYFIEDLCLFEMYGYVFRSYCCHEYRMISVGRFADL